LSAIYFHIPFCKQRCTYCDFYTEVAPQLVDAVIDTMTAELALRKNYLPEKEEVNSIYFGGGTPSLLRRNHFEKLFAAANQHFTISRNAEITFEANPDDLTDEYFEEIKNLLFNRLSIGIQSFNDDFLKKINRRHTAQQAIEAIERAKNHGFKNISIDLIFGLPEQTLDDWKRELETAFSLGIQHLSAYGLTYEQGTALWQQLQLGKTAPTDDETMNEMYFHLLHTAENQKFEAYEISNFAKNSHHSQHNSSYWNGAQYLGIGAAAHSFDGNSRQWNVADIRKYVAAVQNGQPFFQREVLTETDKYNEYIMLRLRTMEGVDIAFVKQIFGEEFSAYFQREIQEFIHTKQIAFSNEHYYLTKQGKILSNLMIEKAMK
jgi:oxygen-independent coproporphyrinogen-3 oxidase